MLLYAKVRDCKSVFVKWIAASPYKSTGMHFDLKSERITSMGEFWPRTPKMLFTALKKEHLAICQLHVNLAPYLILIPSYFASDAHRSGISLTTISLHSARKRPPILKQEDFSILICKSKIFKISKLLSVRNCRSITEILNRIRSSAYKKLLRHCPFRKHPRLDFSNSVSKMSMKEEKSRGDKILP